VTNIYQTSYLQDGGRNQPAQLWNKMITSLSPPIVRSPSGIAGRLILFAEDPLALDANAASDYRRAAQYDALVDQMLQDTFNGNLLYLAASILVFGDDVCVYENARR